MDMFPGYERPTRSNVSDPITTKTVTSGAVSAGPGITVTGMHCSIEINQSHKLQTHCCT